MRTEKVHILLGIGKGLSGGFQILGVYAKYEDAYAEYEREYDHWSALQIQSRELKGA